MPSTRLLVVASAFLILRCNQHAFALSQPRNCAVGNDRYRIAVVGGGASGIFAAITAATTILDANRSTPASLHDPEINVYESTREILRSVRCSGGGRGNILYDASKKPRELLTMGYPRGRKEMASLLTKHFPPSEQRSWFEERGVQFVTESDGKMISADASSRGICALLEEAAEANSISIETGAKVRSISKDRQEHKFRLAINDESVEYCDCIVLATGATHLGHAIARSLGHAIEKPVRSCFGFRLDTSNEQFHLPDGTYPSPYVRLSFKVKVEGQKRPRVFKSEGPIVLTVRDESAILGGMAALHLASFAAPELQEVGYKGSLLVHFSPDSLGGKVEKIEEILWRHRQKNPKELVGERCPLRHEYVDYDNYDFETDSFLVVTNECIPPDLWESLTLKCGASSVWTWSKMSPKKVRAMADLIVGCPLAFEGRYTPEDEFVNCGGIVLNEIDLSTMQSHLVEGLYFCGQVLDGDACHGGFNFMRDWAMASVAGGNAALRALRYINNDNSEK